MKINAISGLYSINVNANKKNIGCKYSIPHDTFVKTCSFSGKRNDVDKQSYTELEKWSSETGFLDKVREIDEKTGQILGSGFEGITFGIPGTDNWVLKKYNRGNFIAIPNEAPKLVRVEDFSPELNVGQTIARVEIPGGSRYSYIYYVLKRQTGESIGVPLSYSDDMSDINVKTHINTLKTLANAPQETFNKCIKDIAYVTQQGYEFDCGNPYNFMFDKEKNHINFVDINDKKRDENTQFGEVLYSLLDGNFAINFSKSDYDETIKDEANKLSNEIIRKFFAAMIQSNSKFSLGTYFNNLLESSLLDETLGCSDKEDKINKLRLMNLI